VIRFFSLLFLAALLIACNPTRWVRPDATPEQADRDDVDCQRWAAREAGTAAFYGAYRYGGYRVRDEAGLHNMCMRAKGYERQ
jgi:hypothetical protein